MSTQHEIFLSWPFHNRRVKVVFKEVFDKWESSIIGQMTWDYVCTLFICHSFTTRASERLAPSRLAHKSLFIEFILSGTHAQPLVLSDWVEWILWSFKNAECWVLVAGMDRAALQGTVCFCLRAWIPRLCLAPRKSYLTRHWPGLTSPPFRRFYHSALAQNKQYKLLSRSFPGAGNPCVLLHCATLLQPPCTPLSSISPV